MGEQKENSQVDCATSEKIKHDYQYLQSILSNSDIEKLKDAIKIGMPILIQGPQGPTGKSTFVKYLRERGVNASEAVEFVTFNLDKFVITVARDEPTWRRFEVINTETLEEAELLLEEKQLNRQDLELLFNTFIIRNT